MKSSNALVLLFLGLIMLLSTCTTKTTQAQTQFASDNLTPHSYLEITSEAQLQDIAATEGWEGTGENDDPIIIEDYLFNGAETDPQIATSIKNSIEFTNPGFHTFSLIISGIQSNIIIRSNQFVSSVLINGTYGQSRMIVENNEWITHDNPTNLFMNGNDHEIRHNKFYGSELSCEGNYAEFPPRVFVYGDHAIIQKNMFEVDDGCYPTTDILLGFPSGLDIIHPEASAAEISSNYFKSCNIAIEARNDAVVFNNDFDVGKYAIITHFQSLETSHNNFYVSELGVIGQQNYQGIEHFAYPSWDANLSEFGRLVFFLFNPNNNYYSNWVSPDENDDGIVDEKYVHYADVIDDSPSTTPFSTYYHPIENTIQLWQPFAIGAIVSISLAAASKFFVIPWVSRQRKIYNGALVGNTKQIIKELFDSQTVLYYTLIGQSKIGDKEIEEKITDAIPKNLLDSKYLLHPVRMAMLKLLYESLEMSSVELKDIIGITWNDYTTHTVSLKKYGYIRIDDGFIDGKRRQLLSILPKGIEEFKMLMDLLHLFLDNSVDYATYIKTAQQKLDASDPDLYPDS